MSVKLQTSMEQESAHSTGKKVNTFCYLLKNKVYQEIEMMVMWNV